MDWSLYPNFSRSEFACKVTGECNMQADLMAILQSMRNQLAKPIYISSGYRSVEHPVEQKKFYPGEHTHGMAVDIFAHGEYALNLIRVALSHDIRRIGVDQKGDFDDRFIHLGIGDRFNLGFAPGIWTY